METFSITVHEHDCARKVNAGFQNPQRPAWYWATQEAIAPKAPLFARICAQLDQRFTDRRSQLNIVEPGVGLGFFFQYLLTQTTLAEKFELHLIGVDVSQEMVLGCRDLLAGVPVRADWKPVHIELHSRVDLLNLESHRIESIAPAGAFDAVVASQFEHSYPNTATSPLAQRLRADGLTACTKHAFRQFARQRLRPHGLYISLDDYLSGDAAQDQENTQRWDAHVVGIFSNSKSMAALSARFPKIAASLQRRYHPSLGLDVLLNKAAQARQRRRHLCNEETSELRTTLEDLEGIFGASRVTVNQHPSPTHRQFYLLWAEL